MYGLKPAIASHILQVILLQLLSSSVGRPELEELQGSRLLLCLFEILKRILASGLSNEFVFIELKKVMEARSVAGFSFANIKKLHERIEEFANPKKLLEFLKNFEDEPPLLNYPIGELVLVVNAEIKSLDGKVR